MRNVTLRAFSALATDILTTCIQSNSHGYTNYVRSMLEPRICELSTFTAEVTDI